MAKAAASSALEDLDLSREEVQRFTSAFQDPEFRRMFSEYAAEITDPENRRRYEEEITALERERGVDVRFVHPEPGHVLRTSLDGEHRCYVNVCSNSLVGVPSSRPGPGRGGTAAGSHWSLPYSLAPGRQYAGRNGARYTVYDVVFHPEALALARSHERFREMLDATALEAVEQQFGVRLDRRNAKTPVDDGRGKAQYNKARRQLVVTLPVALADARQEPPAATPEEPAEETGTDDVARTSAGDFAAAREESADGTGADHGEKSGVGAPDPGAAHAEGELVPEPEQDFGGDSVAPLDLGKGTSPGDRSLPYSAFPGGDTESLCGDPGVQTNEEQERTRHDTAGSAMGDPGTESIAPVCPPLQCNQDEDSLTLLIQVPGILPQTLHGHLSPVGYELCFSTQDSGYSCTLQFAPENKLSTREPETSVSLNNAVIVLAKSPESHGLWREWYCGLNKESLEERLFINEENVNGFLEEVLCSPLKQARSLAPPLIEVLQATDEQVQIHAELQECSDPAGLQGKGKGVREGCPLSEAEAADQSATSPAASDSAAAVEALKINTHGSAVDLQHGCPEVPHVLSGKPLQPEAKMDPEFIRESSTTYSTEEKENIREPVITKGEKINGDHPSSLLNKTVVQNIPDFDTIKETNMQDGSVQIIRDHTTHCAFSFQNPLLYDLD